MRNVHSSDRQPVFGIGTSKTCEVKPNLIQDKTILKAGRILGVAPVTFSTDLLGNETILSRTWELYSVFCLTLVSATVAGIFYLSTEMETVYGSALSFKATSCLLTQALNFQYRHTLLQLSQDLSTRKLVSRRVNPTILELSDLFLTVVLLAIKVFLDLKHTDDLSFLICLASLHIVVLFCTFIPEFRLTSMVMMLKEKVGELIKRGCREDGRCAPVVSGLF